MRFATIARIYRHPTDAISLRDVWTFTDEELSNIAVVALERLKDVEKLAGLHRQVAWATQALIEFWDLANFTRPPKGRLQYNNYLYFEAIGALREATLCMLNASPRAATGLLRSVMEMLLLHCRWQAHIRRTGNSAQFYNWLEGRTEQPKFKDTVRNNLEWLGIPGGKEAAEPIHRTYKRLCSFVHAPIREASVTILNRGNVGYVGVEVLHGSLSLARDMLGIVLEHLVYLHPLCLFPVDINRKFGFNPPVGMYFDRFNFVPLIAVFGKVRIETYRARLKDHKLVEDAMAFYESRPDLTREQVLESFNVATETQTLDGAEDDMVGRWFLVKAEMRLNSMMATYSDPLRPYW